MRAPPRLSTLLPALLALAWGVASSAADEVPKDQAELKLHAAMSGTNASSFFDGYDTEACEDGKGPGRLATFNFFAKKQQSELVRSGAPLYLLGVLHVTPKSGEHMLKNACRSMRSFVPEAGRVYEIRQDASERNCPIAIKDARTGAEVKAQKVKPKGACREKK
jgi:hypothetical protein